MLYESFCMCKRSPPTGCAIIIIIKRIRERFFLSIVLGDCPTVRLSRKQVIIRSSVCIIITIYHTFFFIGFFSSVLTYLPHYYLLRSRLRNGNIQLVAVELFILLFFIIVLYLYNNITTLTCARQIICNSVAAANVRRAVGEKEEEVDR